LDSNELSLDSIFIPPDRWYEISLGLGANPAFSRAKKTEFIPFPFRATLRRRADNPAPPVCEDDKCRTFNPRLVAMLVFYNEYGFIYDF
jgi:hypothetical protein